MINIRILCWAATSVFGLIAVATGQEPSAWMAASFVIIAQGIK